MLEVGGHHHPVPGGVRQLRALGRDTLGQTGPRPVVAHRAAVVVGLELGDTGDLHGLIVA